MMHGIFCCRPADATERQVGVHVRIEGELLIDELISARSDIRRSSGRLDLQGPPHAPTVEEWRWPSDPWPEDGFSLRCVERDDNEAKVAADAPTKLQRYASLVFEDKALAQVQPGDSLRLYDVVLVGAAKAAPIVAHLAVTADYHLSWYAVPDHVEHRGYIRLGLGETLEFRKRSTKLQVECYAIRQSLLGDVEKPH